MNNIKVFFVKSKTSKRIILSSSLDLAIKSANILSADTYIEYKSNIPIEKFSINSKKTISMFYQLGFLIDSGITLAEALYVLCKTGKDKEISGLSLFLKERIEQGFCFSESIAQIKSFNNYQLAILKSGEASNSLASSFKEAAKLEEEISEITGKIKKVLIYPSFLMLASIGLISFLFIVLIPQIKESIDITSQNLPKITTIVFTTSDIINDNLTVIVVLTLFIVGIMIKKRYEIRNRILNIGFINKTYKKFELSICFSILQSLLKKNINISDAFDLASQSSSNNDICTWMKDVKNRIQNGDAPISNTDKIEPLVLSLLSSGFSSNKLDSACECIQRVLKREVKEETEKIIGLLGPSTIILVGVIIGIIIVSMVIPMSSINF